MKRLLMLIGLVLGVLCATSTPAAAGGWAISTLDSLPAAHAGATVEVGFTIRQHGVTPVDLDEGVGIEITGPDGEQHYFAAVHQGATGHYVATVRFPDAGVATWRVRQGWFAAQELGSITIAAPTSSGSGGDDGRLGAAGVRFGLPVAAIALGAWALVQVRRSAASQPMAADAARTAVS